MEPGRFFGYAVDTGLGSFVDVDGARLWEAELESLGDEVPDFLDDEAFDRNGFYSHVIGSLTPQVGNPLGYIIVAFHAGHGDGHYATYVGIDADGRPVCLMTDFALPGTSARSYSATDADGIAVPCSSPEHRRSSSGPAGPHETTV